MITQERLHELFEYNDGNFYWKITASNRKPEGSEASCLRKDGYKVVSIDGSLQLLHRMIFLYHKGYLPSRVDHKDRDNTNNCIENLRDISASSNAVNSNIVTSKHGYKGVTQQKGCQGFIAQIKQNYKTRYLGTYPTPEGAHEAYLKARQELFPGVFN